jgi:hypothetical protein
MYSATTPNMYASMYPNMYANMYANMYTAGMPLVYNPVIYQVSGCRNNDGQAVPCAGEPSLPVVPVEQTQKVQQPAAPQTPAAPVSAAPSAPASSASTGVISVKKREADPAYYYNTINPAMYTLAQQPIIYSQAVPAVSQPVVYAQPGAAYAIPAPVVYSDMVGCRNSEGKVVACIGEPEPKSEAMPMMAKEAAKAAEMKSEAMPLMAKEAAMATEAKPVEMKHQVRF